MGRQPLKHRSDLSVLFHLLLQLNLYRLIRKPLLDPYLQLYLQFLKHRSDLSVRFLLLHPLILSDQQCLMHLLVLSHQQFLLNRLDRHCLMRRSVLFGHQIPQFRLHLLVPQNLRHLSVQWYPRIRLHPWVL